MFTLAEIRLMIEAISTLIAEYGERPEAVELLARLEAERERRVEEIAATRW